MKWKEDVIEQTGQDEKGFLSQVMKLQKSLEVMKTAKIV